MTFPPQKAALLLVLAALLAAGCPVDVESPNVRVINESGGPVDLFREDPEGETRVANTLRDGWQTPLRDYHFEFRNCSSNAFAARRPDGTLVERRPPPLCLGDEWVITGDEPTGG